MASVQVVTGWQALLFRLWGHNFGHKKAPHEVRGYLNDIDVEGLKLTCGPGSDLLSHTLRCSTIGAKGLNGRVRDGNGCDPLAITTQSAR